MTHKIGDTLYFVYNDRRRGNPFDITITKIGRKWLTVSPTFAPRIDAQSLEADGGAYTSPGRAYRSRDEYERLVAITAAWSKLKEDLRNHSSPPASVMFEDISEVRALLLGGPSLRRELAEARADHKMVTELYNAAVADYDQAFRNGLEKSAQIAAGYECRLAEYPSDEAERYYQGGAIDASIGIAAAIRSAMEGKAK